MKKLIYLLVFTGIFGGCTTKETTPDYSTDLVGTYVSGLCVVALSRNLKLTTTLDRAITQNPCYVPLF